MTNRNSGSQVMIAPVEENPSSPSAHEFWNTSTSSPYAAPTDSRFITIALSGTTSERNASSSSTKLRPSTSAKIHGVRLVTIPT